MPARRDFTLIREPTWAELEAAANTTPKKIQLELQQIFYTASKYEKFVELIEKALNYSAGKMVAVKNIINKEQSEDQLTYMLSAPLLGMGFDISHSTNQGGHCDIVIEGDEEMLWLGEAKKYTDYSKLMGGHQQLLDRYASGLSSQLNGGIIIYMFGKKAASMMNEWRKYLEDSRDALRSEDIANQPLQFRTVEPHRATEREISVRHIAIPLFHEPTDPLPPPPRRRVA
jgi:hypothetical protein